MLDEQHIRLRALVADAVRKGLEEVEVGTVDDRGARRLAYLTARLAQVMLPGTAVLDAAVKRAEQLIQQDSAGPTPVREPLVVERAKSLLLEALDEGQSPVAIAANAAVFAMEILPEDRKLAEAAEFALLAYDNADRGRGPSVMETALVTVRGLALMNPESRELLRTEGLVGNVVRAEKEIADQERDGARLDAMERAIDGHLAAPLIPEPELPRRVREALRDMTRARRNGTEGEATEAFLRFESAAHAMADRGVLSAHRDTPTRAGDLRPGRGLRNAVRKLRRDGKGHNGRRGL